MRRSLPTPFLKNTANGGNNIARMINTTLLSMPNLSTQKLTPTSQETQILKQSQCKNYHPVDINTQALLLPIAKPTS
jgi:hypothetical protein